MTLRDDLKESGFPGGSHGKESACNAGDPGSIPGLERSPGEGIGNPLSTLAWRLPWTEEPGRPQSMGLQRLGHDLATNTFPFFPGGSDGKESACLRSDP